MTENILKRILKIDYLERILESNGDKDKDVSSIEGIITFVSELIQVSLKIGYK